MNQHGLKNRTAWRSLWDRMHSLVKEQKDRLAVPKMRLQNCNQPQRPTRATNKNCNCGLSKENIDLEQRRSAHAKSDFKPQKWNLKAHMWYKCGHCDAARPRQHSPILRYSALLRYSESPKLIILLGALVYVIQTILVQKLTYFFQRPKLI